MKQILIALLFLKLIINNVLYSQDCFSLKLPEKIRKLSCKFVEDTLLCIVTDTNKSIIQKYVMEDKLKYVRKYEVPELKGYQKRVIWHFSVCGKTMDEVATYVYSFEENRLHVFPVSDIYTGFGNQKGKLYTGFNKEGKWYKNMFVVPSYAKTEPKTLYLLVWQKGDNEFEKIKSFELYNNFDTTSRVETYFYNDKIWMAIENYNTILLFDGKTIKKLKLKNIEGKFTADVYFRDNSFGVLVKKNNSNYFFIYDYKGSLLKKVNIKQIKNVVGYDLQKGVYYLNDNRICFYPF